MPGQLYISKEQIAEIEEARKKNKDKRVDRRLKVLLMYVEGHKHAEIAKQTEYATTYISELVVKYVDKGLSAIIGNHYRGNRRNMSIEAEKELLEVFKKRAASGQIIETSEIKKAYEAATGKSLDKSHGQIYRVLKRHGWRKVMPRSRHPKKASVEAVEASKKLTKR
jgi:transposase